MRSILPTRVNTTALYKLNKNPRITPEIIIYKRNVELLAPPKKQTNKKQTNNNNNNTHTHTQRKKRTVSILFK